MAQSQGIVGTVEIAFEPGEDIIWAAHVKADPRFVKLLAIEASGCRAAGQADPIDGKGRLAQVVVFVPDELCFDISVECDRHAVSEIQFERTTLLLSGRACC